MDRIGFYTDKSQLDGTGYIEFSPGIYSGKHWQDGCIFFDEESYYYIEKIIEKNVPGYDFYEMNDADSVAWSAIIRDLNKLIKVLEIATKFDQLDGSIGFRYSNTKSNFESNFEKSRQDLLKMIKGLVLWAKPKLEMHGAIAILGL